MRVAVVASHPIQYQAPWFRALARRVDLQVFFCHQQDAAGQAAAGYGQAFEWDMPLLEGYEHHWLRNVASPPGVFRYGGCDTPEIADRLAAGRFDVCIVCGWYLKSYLQAIRACRRLGVPVLLRGDSHLGTTRSLMKRTLKYVPYRVLLNAVDGHLVVGVANRAYLRHFGVPESRLFFVPHFVDTDWFAARARDARADNARDRIRAGLGIPESAPVVLFVGRLVPMKRPLDLVVAVAAHRHADRVHAVLVGDGPMAGEIQTRAARENAAVHLAGFRNQRELAAWYIASDVLALPSDAGETWGLVLNEAMACGLPVVVSDAVGAAPDLVRDGTGRTFPLGDIDACAAMIQAMLDLRRREPARVDAALRAVSREYGCEAAVDATMTALNRVVERRRAA
jgi:glycosyltransferase involved in cell wall biosynthesis